MTEKNPLCLCLWIVFVFSYYKVKSVVMAKRTCYKLFKNLLKYIYIVFLGSSPAEQKTKPSRRSWVDVTSCRFSLWGLVWKDSAFGTECFPSGTFETHDVWYCTCLPPTKYTSENTKKKDNTDVFCLFLTSFYPSFFLVYFFFEILLAHIVPAILLESRYVFPRLHEESSAFFDQCKICPPSSASNASLFLRLLSESLPPGRPKGGWHTFPIQR